MPLHSSSRCPTGLSPPSRASVILWEATAPVKLPTRQGSGPGSRGPVRRQKGAGWYFKGGSTKAGAPASRARVRHDTGSEWYFTAGSGAPERAPSQPPTYPTQPGSRPTGKLE